MALNFELLRRLMVEKRAQRVERLRVWAVAIVSLMVVFVSFYSIYIKSPSGFPVNSLVNVKESSSLSDITELLHRRRVINSPVLFRTLVILFYGEKQIKAGDYLFDKKLNIFSAVERLAKGEFGLVPVKITLPEGMTTKQMAVVLNNNLIDFDEEEFIKLSEGKEGYNFPDTYLFLPNVRPKKVVDTLQDNFNEKIKSIEKDIAKFKKPIKDVVVMASILEAEARTMESRKIIADILWRRINIGMPLQVDAPFQYIIGKNTFQLTTSDLKFDSPYNTYKYKGLPPGAIGNPGLDAIIATVNPTKTNYLYYLSDIRGGMHYATTYKEHLLNKEKYLK